MLKRLLSILGQSGSQSKADLARQLGVSEETLEQMIAQIVSPGYLRVVDRTCDGACGGCPLANTCAIKGSGRLWALTEKGDPSYGPVLTTAAPP